MKTIYLIIFAQFVLIAALFFFHFASNKIACIDNTRIIIEYKGMKKANDASLQKLSKYYYHIDSLKAEYKKEYDIATTNKTLSKKNDKTLKLEQDIAAYSERLNQIEAIENKKNAEIILEEVNAKINNYAIKNNYDLIIGETTMGNVVFKSDKFDITDDVLKYMNNEE